MNKYLITLEIVIEAESPEDAAREFQKWVNEGDYLLYVVDMFSKEATEVDVNDLRP